MRHASWLLVTVFVPQFAHASAAPQLNSPHLCSAQKQVLFSCRAGSKIVSICREGVAAQPPIITLRIGGEGGHGSRSGTSSPLGGRAIFFSHQLTSGGGLSHVRFRGVGEDFTVYSYFQSPNWSLAGAVIQRHGRVLRRYNCNDPSRADLDVNSVSTLPHEQFVDLPPAPKPKRRH